MNFKQIGGNIISNAIWAILVIIGTVAYNYRDNLTIKDFIVFFIAATVLVIVLIHRKQYFIATGIKRVYSRLGAGMVPQQSLVQCQDNIRFLGIAANKLIYSDGFEEAIKRCNRTGTPIRFLLSSPDNPIIKNMALRAKRDENEFRNMIIGNLKKLDKLKKENGYNMGAPSKLVQTSWTIQPV